jgi:hypothetical protein
MRIQKIIFLATIVIVALGIGLFLYITLSDAFGQLQQQSQQQLLFSTTKEGIKEDAQGQVNAIERYKRVSHLQTFLEDLSTDREKEEAPEWTCTFEFNTYIHLLYADILNLKKLRNFYQSSNTAKYIAQIFTINSYALNERYFMIYPQ